MRDSGPARMIYDAGMNNGDDTAYYLAKGYDVVAIEANPLLCSAAEQRFAREIAGGRVRVLNVGLAERDGTATFFVNEGDDAISTFAPERFADKPWADPRWSPVEVATARLSDIIVSNGPPAFVKLDVEFHDTKVLIDLLRAGIIPPMLSVEAQEPDTFHALVRMGYRSFRLSPGVEVPTRYADATITRITGERIAHRFPAFSSGPFGDDLAGDWLDRTAAFAELQSYGFGWIDVHAKA